MCIHRGSQEIGGSCVEVEHDRQRLVLDIGLPLDADITADNPLPPVVGLNSGDESLVGLLISHGHPDHYGLARGVHPSVPLYVGEATERILEEALFFSPAGARLVAAGYLSDRDPIDIGPFRVTPFLVDHSAFDAYALLVEAGGRRLLYSGDLRAHGRKSSLVERLLHEPPANVDVLLLEGTNIRDAPVAGGPSETDVEERCVERFKATKGMVLACYSPQNVDHLVTLHRAANRSGRMLVLDLYAAGIANATGAGSIPQADWSTVRVFVPQSQRIRVKRAEAFERTAAVRGRRIFPEELAAQADNLVMTFRASMRGDLDRAACLDGAHAVWSMWPGYLENEPGGRLRDWLGRGIGLDLIRFRSRSGARLAAVRLCRPSPAGCPHPHQSPRQIPRALRQRRRTRRRGMVDRMSLPHAPRTPIVTLYEDLKKRHADGGPKIEERLALCRGYVADPKSLGQDFAESVALMEQFAPWDEPFYDIDETGRQDDTYEVTGSSVGNTKAFAMRLRERRTCEPLPASRPPLMRADELDEVSVVDAERLAFEYLDRELPATRVSTTIEREATNVLLDLMLANLEDRTAIVGELKRTADIKPAEPHLKPNTDRDPFSALIQALACASQLTSSVQYERLNRYGRWKASAAELATSAPPTFDLYIVLHNRPSASYQAELLLDTERLSAGLLALPDITGNIRRIACFVSQVEGGELDLRTEFAYERPSHTAGATP